MTNLSRLTVTDLHLCLENGGGISYLCDKYDCHEDQIVKRIKKLYKGKSKKATKMLGALRENDKKILRGEPEEATSQVNEEVAATEANEKIGEERAPAIELVKGGGEFSSFEDISEKEEELSRELCELESRHRDFVDTHRANLYLKREVLDQIDELERKFVNLGQEYETLCAESEEIKAEMSQISARIREKKDLLNQIREEKCRLQKIVIYVYDDETISAPESEIKLDDSGFQKISGKLIQRPECRRLAIWQIELLARTIKIMVRLEERGLTAEFLFDNSEIEEAYVSLSAEYRIAKKEVDSKKAS